MNERLIYLVSAVVTPLVIYLWGALFPPEENLNFQHLSDEELYSRNNWIDVTAQVLCVLPIILTLVLLESWKINSFGFWGIGFVFGLMVIFPCIFIAIVTLPKGIKRFYEFWYHYENTYGIGIKSLTVVYIFISLIGIVSFWNIAT